MFDPCWHLFVQLVSSTATPAAGLLIHILSVKVDSMLVEERPDAIPERRLGDGPEVIHEVQEHGKRHRLQNTRHATMHKVSNAHYG